MTDRAISSPIAVALMVLFTLALVVLIGALAI
ncbi:MAG: archaellin/type IV pilin N-terminal domain-containing protein [Halanaeroarchaeum sp.]